MMSPPNQRRANPRVALEVSVTLESDDNFYAGIANDVSEGGVFVATYQPPPVGATVDLTLILPDSAEQFACSGVVRWIRDLHPASCDAPNGCGIQWTEMPAGAIAAIRRFVSLRDTMLFEDAA